MRDISSRILFLAALFAFGLTIATAQDTGGVKGKVRSAKGDGIASATVTARQKGEDIKSVSADADGNFELTGLKPGNYNLVFTKNGYSVGVLYNVEVKKKKTSDLGERLVLSVDQGTQVIIKGSVFAADGRSVSGAEIKIEQMFENGSTKKVGSGFSTYNGEFTFRFAEGSAKYRVTVKMKDAVASKEIEVSSAAIYRLAVTLNTEKN